MSWRKSWQTQKLFCSNKKGNLKVDKDGNEDIVTITYKIKFIYSTRCMTSSLSNLLDNLEEGNHKIKCKDCYCFLEYEYLITIY